MLLALALFILTSAASCQGSVICNVTDYGAVPGALDPAVNTAAFVRAIAHCSSARASPDDLSVVLVPPGTFLVASLDLSNSSNLQLRITHGAVLLGSPSESDYPLIPPWPSYAVGRDVPTSLRYRPLIFAANASNLHITGGGCIDGNGEPWCVTCHSKFTHARRSRFNALGLLGQRQQLPPKVTHVADASPQVRALLRKDTQMVAALPAGVHVLQQPHHRQPAPQGLRILERAPVRAPAPRPSHKICIRIFADTRHATLSSATCSSPPPLGLPTPTASILTAAPTFL